METEGNLEALFLELTGGAQSGTEGMFRSVGSQS
jgi:hypothetical protein